MEGEDNVASQETIADPTSESSPNVSSDERSAVQNGNKRARSRPSGPLAVMDVADALRDVASSFKDSGDPHSTPRRRSDAVRAIEDDTALSPTTKRQFLGIIRKDMAAADVYLAIK